MSSPGSNLEIGFLLSTLGTTRGGLETRALSLGEVLAGRGHRIYMVGGYWPGIALPPDLAQAPAIWLRVPAPLADIAATRIVAPGWPHIARSTIFTSLCRVHPGVRRLMRRADITMTLLARETAALSAWRAGYGRAHISYFSGGDKQWMDRDRSAVRLINPSVAIRKNTQLDGLALPGIADSWFAEAPAAARPRSTRQTLLFVGRLEANKGVHDLIEILAGLNPQVELRICGDGPLLRPLQQAAESSAVASRVTFLGACSHSEVQSEMRQAGLLLLPTRHENFPITLLESQAAGLPFLASDIEGIRNHVHPEAHLLPPGNIAVWSEAITVLLQDDAERLRSALAGREWARQYTWSRAADDLEHYCSLALSRTAVKNP